MSPYRKLNRDTAYFAGCLVQAWASGFYWYEGGSRHSRNVARWEWHGPFGSLPELELDIGARS